MNDPVNGAVSEVNCVELDINPLGSVALVAYEAVKAKLDVVDSEDVATVHVVACVELDTVPVGNSGVTCAELETIPDGILLNPV